MNSVNIEKKVPSWATRKELTTPVLYMVFNRPEITQESFNAIREAKPKKLYVAVDAPRVNRKDDEENQAKVIQIVKNVDWDCNVKYLIHEKNLGCSRAGIAAWNWLFSQEDRMIFVEDDGVPSVSFFYYCQELLEDYKDNDKIAYIGGVNYGMKRGEASYFFTRQCAATYAMGTWKRVYDLYEYDMASYPEYRNKKSFKEAFSNKKSYYGHLLMFDSYADSLKKGIQQNTYDVQMLYLVHKYDKYSIYPNTNMVSNIGLAGGANNNVDVNSAFYKAYHNRPRFELIELKHPAEISINKEFDAEMAEYRQSFLGRSRWQNSYICFVHYVNAYFHGLYKFIRTIKRKF